MDFEQKDVGQVLQKLYNTLSVNFGTCNNNKRLKTTTTNVDNIENILNQELEILHNNYITEENEYVEQMLIDEPPIVNNRRNNTENQLKDIVKIQKAESCRKSRLNNKIKNAKRKFRHDFISDKLIKSKAVFKYINEVIEQAENQLIRNGTINKFTILKLRNSIGMDNKLKTNNAVRNTTKE